MKQSLKKIGCLALAAALSLAVLAGCGKGEDSSSTAPGALPGMTVAQAKGDEAIVVNGEPVSNDIVSYMTFMYCLQSLAADENYFDSADNVSYLKQLVLEDVKQYVLPDYIAKAHDITLSEEDLAEIEKIYQDMVADYGGEDAMKQVLESNHISMEMQKDLIRSQYLQKKLLVEYYGKDYNKDNVYRAKHVLIKYDTIPTGEDGKPTMTEEEWRADRLALAQEISKRAQDGEDFDALIKEYNEDPGMQQNPNGYYFVEGQMMPEFYEGTKALEIGKVGEPVEVNAYYKGFHVIQRLEVTEENLKDEIMRMAATAPETQMDVQQVIAGMTVQPTEKFEAVLETERKNAADYLKAAADKETVAAESKSTAE